MPSEILNLASVNTCREAKSDHIYSDIDADYAAKCNKHRYHWKYCKYHCKYGSYLNPQRPQIIKHLSIKTKKPTYLSIFIS